MRFFLYKIIFPECHKLYFGRSGSEFRYGKRNKIGCRFYGPHHNPEVQNLLNAGFAAFFIKIAVFKDEESSRLSEERYLKKVWKTDDFVSRPKWLMNRNRSSIGFSSGDLHPSKSEKSRKAASERLRGNKLGAFNRGRRNTWMTGDNNHMRRPEHRQECRENVGKLHTPEARDKASKTRRETLNRPGYVSPLVGKSRPDVAERNKSEEYKKRSSENCKILHTCPECGLQMNAGNLAKHLRARHETNLHQTIKSKSKNPSNSEI